MGVGVICNRTRRLAETAARPVSPGWAGRARPGSGWSPVSLSQLVPSLGSLGLHVRRQRSAPARAATWLMWRASPSSPSDRDMQKIKISDKILHLKYFVIFFQESVIAGCMVQRETQRPSVLSGTSHICSVGIIQNFSEFSSQNLKWQTTASKLYIKFFSTWQGWLELNSWLENNF